MRRWFVGCLSILGLMFLLLVGGIATTVWYISDKVPGQAELPDQAVLHLTLSGAPLAGSQSSFEEFLNQHQLSLRGLLDGIDRAAEDGRVQGLLVDLSHASLSLSDAEELAAAVGRFRQAGKPAYAFADTFGESGDGTTGFMLASAFDQIWMQPSGEVRLLGMALERPYIAETLRMLGVAVRIDQRHEFKGIADIFTDDAMNPALRGQLQRLVDDMTRQAVTQIATGRRLEPEAVTALLAVSPLPAQGALTEKLVDRLGYRADAVAALASATRTTTRISFAQYRQSEPVPRSIAATEGPAIAVIEGVGEVVRGGAPDPFGDEEGFSATRLARAFEAAARDTSVRAILFRIDSPGGSYVASDTVWAAVRAARQAGKPVVVSMGRLAASGGYFAALPADRIFASAGTLTGSIGVGGGKFVLTDLWSKLGVRWDRVEGAPHAGQDSPNRDYTPEELARQGESLDRIYADFTQKVAEARKIPLEGMDEVARGRIWTGAQAKDIGLVDAVGGWREALWEARRLAKLSPDLPIRLIDYPEKESPFEQFQRLMSAADQTRSTAQMLNRMLAQIRPLLTTSTGELTGPVR